MAPTGVPATSIGIRVDRALAFCALVLVAAGSASFLTPAAAQTAPVLPLASLQADAFPERNPNREGGVYDTVDILTTAQEKSIQTDITRASRLGVEMLVYTRMSDESLEESQAFADRLNAEWGVESSEGASDGLVYLVTVNPLDPDTNSLVISVGKSALPIRQLDGTGLQRILETDIAPEVADGEFNTAIQFGIRRVLNAMEYSPPSPDPLSAVQQALHTTANILGVALLQLSVLGFFVVTIVRERRFTVVPGAGSLGIYAVCLAVASTIVGVVAIAGRNAFASLTALGVLIVAACFIPLLIGPTNQRAARHSAAHVRPRAAHQTSAIGTVDG